MSSTSDSPVNDAGYESKNRNYFGASRSEMLPFVPVSARKILEIGCGRAEFAANLKALRDVHIAGVESFDAAASVAKGIVDELIHASAEVALNELPSDSFDCVIMNDVIEHLVDPWVALRGVKRMLTENGHFVASIPNIRYFPVLREYFIEGQWRYRDDGVMDRTHLRFFTRNSIRNLLIGEGFHVDSLQGINRLKILPWKFALLRRITGDMFEDVVFKQFACVARPK